jgi:hypothetical protein
VFLAEGGKRGGYVQGPHPCPCSLAGFAERCLKPPLPFDDVASKPQALGGRRQAEQRRGSVVCANSSAARMLSWWAAIV